jgi:hypothetical protein
MTRASSSRLARRNELTFGDVVPKNWVMPEDIPVLFRQTAEECAGAFFEENKRSVRFRGRWRNARQYIRLNWPSYLPIARTILAGMLQNPGISLAQKEEISKAFLGQAADKRLLDMSEHLAPGAVN